jgi:hypothetical protein
MTMMMMMTTAAAVFAVKFAYKASLSKHGVC